MSDRPVITPQHWLEQALQDRQAARVLAAKALWAHAFHHAGFAIERALKYRIMRRHGWNAWPDRLRYRDLYTRDLILLAREASVADQLAREIEAQSELGLPQGLEVP